MGKYRTSGLVRGRCDHEHRSVTGAYTCLKQDQRGCEKQGGYSDRHVVRIGTDDKDEKLTAGDRHLLNTLVELNWR